MKLVDIDIESIETRIITGYLAFFLIHVLTTSCIGIFKQQLEQIGKNGFFFSTILYLLIISFEIFINMFRSKIINMKYL